MRVSVKVSEASVSRNRSTIIVPAGSTRDEGWAAFRNILADINEASRLFVLPNQVSLWSTFLYLYLFLCSHIWVSIFHIVPFNLSIWLFLCLCRFSETAKLGTIGTSCWALRWCRGWIHIWTQPACLNFWIESGQISGVASTGWNW